MKMDHPLNEDKALSALLGEWKVEASLPPRFQEGVWRRIEREQAPAAPTTWPWAILQRWIANVLPRPALAVASITILLAAGAGIGWTHAQIETERVHDQLSVRYVKSVDPYLALR